MYGLCCSRYFSENAPKPWALERLQKMRQIGPVVLGARNVFKWSQSFNWSSLNTFVIFPWKYIEN